MNMRLAALVVMAGMSVPAAWAQIPGTAAVAEFPWFGSLKKNEVNVRSGPGNQYPILWVYQRAGYPVEVLARYDNYYKIRDVEGEEGWTYIGMISRKPTALVGGKTPANLSRSASLGSPLVARLAPGVVVDIDKCEDVADVGTLCKVEAPGTSGWLHKRNLDMIK